jgi:hypothetical protein
MKIRLVKPDISPPERKKQPPDEVQIVQTIQSWIQEYKSSKADKVRLDFRTNQPDTAIEE